MCLIQKSITNIYSYQEAVNAPEAVANPRTPNGESTFFDALREEPAAGRHTVKTRWVLGEERMPLES
jgi:hypothetical protein